MKLVKIRIMIKQEKVATSEDRDKIGESRQNRRIATKSEDRDKIGDVVKSHADAFIEKSARKVLGRPVARY